MASPGSGYLSAGAMVAPVRAIVGGYRIRGTEVCSVDWSEGLEEVEIREGLGLVPFAVDVHAAQAGTLGRAVGAVAKGLVDRAAAVDENTALVPFVSRAAHRYLRYRNVWFDQISHRSRLNHRS